MVVQTTCIGVVTHPRTTIQIGEAIRDHAAHLTQVHGTMIYGGAISSPNQSLEKRLQCRRRNPWTSD